MRYFVAFIAVACGIGASALEFACANGHALAKNSPEESAFVFGVCVTFYGTVYATGRLVYAVMGRLAEQEVLRRTASVHMLLLHSLAVALVVRPRLRGLSHLPLLRPAMVAAILPLAISILDLIRARRKPR